MPVSCEVFWAKKNRLAKGPESFRLLSVCSRVASLDIWSWLYGSRLFKLIFREEGREGERKGEKHRCVRETLIGCLSHAPSWGPGPQSRYVSWPGIELATFQFPSQCSVYWAIPARAKLPRLLKDTDQCKRIWGLSWSYQLFILPIKNI